MIKNIKELAVEIEEKTCVEHKHVNVELKSEWSQKNGQKISAQSNKLNEITCFLVVGVDDNGELLGKSQKWAKQTEEIVSQHINANLDPIQSCKSIDCLELSKGWVIVITTQNAGEVGYWNKKAYKSAGSSIAEMEPKEVLELRTQLPGLIDYSNQFKKSSYQTGLLEDFTTLVVRNQNILESSSNNETDCLSELGIKDRQTARILFGPAKYRWVEYDENDDIILNRQGKGLYSLIQQSSIADLSAKYKGVVSTKTLREALANAVAHASYFEQDGDIMVELYPSKIVVSNLCLAESAHFANRWFSRGHKTVNGTLMETLRVAQLVDELGRGKNIIFTESLRSGLAAPKVTIENAGKYSRWKLTVFSSEPNSKHIRLIERCKELFKDDRKALIAVSLVLWCEHPLKEVLEFSDSEYQKDFYEVIAHKDSPVFYIKDTDKIGLKRWTKVLLGEGKNSKVFSKFEENLLKQAVYEMSTEFQSGEVTPSWLRQCGMMGETRSEQSLSSTMLKNWVDEGLLVKMKRGKYRFVVKPLFVAESVFTKKNPNSEKGSGIEL